MKKIIALWALPVMFLASCAEKETTVQPQDTTNIDVVDNSWTTADIQSLDANITSTTTTDNMKSFSLKDDNWTVLDWTLEIVDGKVASIKFAEAIDTSKWYNHKFASKIEKMIVWKEISSFTLPPDVVSGASWVAMQFNEFVKTLK